MKQSIVPLLALAFLLGGCAFNAGYNPTYFPPKAVTLGIKGKGLVVISESDASWSYSGSPKSFTGGGTTLTLPLGEITKQAALIVFGAAFADGVDYRTTPGDTAPYRMVIKPRVAQMQYAYNQLKNLGFAVTPQVEMDLSVTLTDGSGKVLLEQVFKSGLLDGDSYFVSGQPAEKVNKLVHVALFRLMSDAAAEAKKRME